MKGQVSDIGVLIEVVLCEWFVQIEIGRKSFRQKGLNRGGPCTLFTWKCEGKGFTQRGLNRGGPW